MQILGLVGGSDYKDWIKYLLRKQQKEAQVKKPNQTKRQSLFIVFYSVWLLNLYIDFNPMNFARIFELN